MRAVLWPTRLTLSSFLSQNYVLHTIGHIREWLKVFEECKAFGLVFEGWGSQRWLAAFVQCELCNNLGGLETKQKATNVVIS